MKLIMKLSRMIEEEIRDAEKYARCAIEHKEDRPELSRTFVALAEQEMGHMQMLHNAVVQLIEEQRRTQGEPPAGMMEAYDLIHEWQMDHADEAQALIRRAKE
jgi:rubrerythrin